MTDQCKNCMVRGDIEKCLSTKCFHHENWIASQHKERYEALLVQVRELDLQLGLNKMALEHKSALLESCEKALNERDQKNEALLAQVEELRKFKDHEIGQFVNDVTAIAVKYAGCQSMRGALSAYIAPKLQAVSQQSLDSLKARIEAETIDRCANKVAIFYGAGAGSKAIKNMARKYQLPTEFDNPSCFKKQLGVEACNNGCPVSDECYRSE